MQTTRFILIRHAETEANVSKKVWQGSSDTPLTIRGELQVAATAAHVATLHRRHAMLVVTHGGVIRNLLGLWIGNGPDDWQRWNACNCSITILERRDQTWYPLLLNDTSHLPPEAVVTQSEFREL